MNKKNKNWEFVNEKKKKILSHQSTREPNESLYFSYVWLNKIYIFVDNIVGLFGQSTLT